MTYFDRDEWEAAIESHLWYEKIPQLLQATEALRLSDYAGLIRLKTETYSFFEENLNSGRIALGANGRNWDSDRKKIDTIVIHHTGCPQGLSKGRLSAMELIRLYAPAYARRGRKEAIYSGHIREGKQVFYPYHWMIRSNGMCERLLLDHETGWHAGNWEINCRSVAICIDNNHENSAPNDTSLRAIAQLIRHQYPQVPKHFIHGHREINPKTMCPSNDFLDSSAKRGWKRLLLNMV